MSMPRFADLNTDQTLDSFARQAVKKHLSQDVVRDQRVSFVMGMVGQEAGITRAFVEKVIAREEGVDE